MHRIEAVKYSAEPVIRIANIVSQSIVPRYRRDRITGRRKE
jgi:hypothetical protein